MKLLFALLTIIFQFIHVENSTIRKPYTLRLSRIDVPERELSLPIDESAIDTVLRDEEVVAHTLRGGEIVRHEKFLGLKVTNEKESEDYDNEDYKPNQEDISKELCAIVVLSNAQNPNMQSLIRKYRYDANGALIPSSVKYFMKSSQGFGSNPILVPLNDKAFSPLGGFVRYYKEVPPIPHSW